MNKPQKALRSAIIVEVTLTKKQEQEGFVKIDLSFSQQAPMIYLVASRSKNNATE